MRLLYHDWKNSVGIDEDYEVFETFVNGKKWLLYIVRSRMLGTVGRCSLMKD